MTKSINNRSKKVFVGISGGVDSAVAASILLDQGYDVTGVFMKNWSGTDYGIQDECPWREDLESAIQVCKFLDIPHITYNFEKEYRKLVISNFFAQYKAGNTPNPDVLCNVHIKFDAFLEKALADGADYIATGHYSNTKGGRLYKAKDTNKDQTYFLSGVTSDQLSKSIFPLGDMTKTEVREYAEKRNLPNAKRPDSQGICFVGKIDMDEFLSLEISKNEGDIVDIDTNQVVGKHTGVAFYTIGQRKGLHIGGLSKPYFVTKKNIDSNILYVAAGKDHPSLWSTHMEVTNMHYVSNNPQDIKYIKTATIRYRSKDTPVTVKQQDNGTLLFTFDKPQWAGATGQYLVAFDEDMCIGNGVITDIKHNPND